jgi:dihydropteroate synthase
VTGVFQEIRVNGNSLKVGDRVIDLSVPVVMGIVNVTPDSFSDGGKLRTDTPSSRFTVSIDKALAQAESMLAEGATILDIGGESTRPGARPLSEQEELDRVIPVLEAIQDRLDVAVSVDTSTPGVMLAAVAAGAGFVNDVRALQRPGAVAAVSSGKSAVCLMHMRGEPGTMQQEIHYDDVVEEVLAFLRQRIAVCEAAGILRSRLILDPGFGFGKTVRHNWLLLQNLHCFKSLGLPILAGISRKSMLGAVTGRPVDERVHAGVAAAMLALRGGAAIIRTHDVAPTVDAIKIHCAVEGAR